MELLNNFFDIVNNPEGIPSPAMVDELEQRYPYFVLPAQIMLARGGNILSDSQRQHLAVRVALHCGNPATLFTLTSDLAPELAAIYPEEKKTTPETTDAIDTFLQHYCTPDEKENALLERLIFNPVPDYASQLAAEEAPGGSEKEADDTIGNPDTPESLSDLISRINSAPAASEPQTEPEAAQTPEKESQQPESSPRHASAAGSTFSESLAKIYIRQQRYDKALEIISQLSLNFPEKSIYFADQIRFLQKLILNRSYNS